MRHFRLLISSVLLFTVLQTIQGQFYVNYKDYDNHSDSVFNSLRFFKSDDGKQFSIGNSQDKGFDEKNNISHVRTISRMKSNSVEIPQGSELAFSDLTVFSDGEEIPVDDDGFLGPCLGDIIVFNGDNIVYLSFGDEDESRTIDSQETAVSLLLPVVPYCLTEMDSDDRWLLKQMIGHLNETRELAKAIKQTIKDKGYFDMEAINPQYLAAVAELERRLGFDEPSHIKMNLANSTTYPLFEYGGDESYGQGFTIIKEKSIWGTGLKGDCWNCEFTILNADRWCYTSFTKAKKLGEKQFDRVDSDFSDTFRNLVKPMNVSAFMDFGTLSDLATNPKEWLVTLSDPDFDRVANLLWEPLKNVGHLIKGESTETVTYDKIKVPNVKFELYPNNEHLYVVGPGKDKNLQLFNILKILFQPLLKLAMKDVDVMEGSDGVMDIILKGFLKYISEFDLTFRYQVIAKITDSNLPWSKRLEVVEDIFIKFLTFIKDDVVLKYISKSVYTKYLKKLSKGYDDPQVKAIFAAYKSVLTAGDIILLLLDINYEGLVFEIKYGPSFDGYYKNATETFNVNGVEFTMVKLPGGPFMMGAMDDDKNATSNEKPQHSVTLSPFAIGETEVTQGLWKAVMGNNPSHFQNNNLPVENVSWLDCQEFISKLNEMTKNQPNGGNFRLPTEAEWEFAACGGLYNRGYKYSGSNDVKSVAWYKDNSDKKTHNVRLKQANAFDLYDMSGNVLEWCQDSYDASFYGHSSETDPCNDATATLYEHVLRGGCWHWDDNYCRVTSRSNNGQGVKSEISGLRLAMSDNQHGAAPDLQLSATSITLTPGSQGTVDVVSGSGSYAVKSSNKNVATATREGSKVIITAVAVGTAVITVKDQQTNETADIQVTVSDVGTAQTETITVNGVSFKMVAVDGGTFWMGSADDDSEADDDEKPRHQVTLSSFSIGQTEVTQELWEAVMGNNPSYHKGANLPVERVSWNDSQTFISKLNEMTGQKFRLPTEAEWEYAARGGKYSHGYKYAGSNDIDAVAWYVSNCNSETHPVAQKQANELGLYDMSGNVYEWCQDWYSSNYYSVSPSANPCNTTGTSDRVWRGGTWLHVGKNCRVTSRKHYASGPNSSDLGLRLALSDGGGSQESYLTCPDDHHPHLIDLGLPSGTKWACCNVDSDPTKQTPTNYGGYYAWGETEEKDYYYWDTYIHCDGTQSTCHDLGSDIAGTEYDVAHVKWGGSWVMPSLDQIDELLDNTTSTWTTMNGIKGRLFTGSNGGSVFLPAAGCRWYDDFYDVGDYGRCWSSSQSPSSSGGAYYLIFYSGDADWRSGDGRRGRGQSVRPVSR